MLAVRTRAVLVEDALQVASLVPPMHRHLPVLLQEIVQLLLIGHTNILCSRNEQPGFVGDEPILQKGVDPIVSQDILEHHQGSQNR